MTVSEACSKIFTWFEENEKFDLAKDYKSLFVITDDEEAEREVIRIALKKIEDIKVVVKLNTARRDVWVLDKSLNSYEQNITINGSTATQIAEIINKTCTAIDNYEDVCNPLEINEQDLNNIIFICQKMYEHNSEKNNLT